jgi:hypothetical protein
LKLVIALVVLILFFGAKTALGRDNVDSEQQRAKNAICDIFESYCRQALSVSWCESRWRVWAKNGQYLGLFQMGSWERRKYGHGDGGYAQARAAFRYFIASGRDWGPWDCKP